MRKWNFSSGPAVLPEPVLRKAQGAILDFEGSGIGILEHSHRGPEFSALADRCEKLVREVGRVPDDYVVMFLQGGASAQFHMVPMNLLAPDRTADYCVTGSWGQKAVAEAKRFGTVHVACSGEGSQFRALPDTVRFSDNPAYVHVTSNETIAGVQWPSLPEPPDGVPLICDASSDIFSRPLDVSRYGLIYAGAQKNLGPSGLVLAIARRELVEGARRDLPTMLQYRTWATDHSLYNTPPTFSIYVMTEVLAWLIAEGGPAAMAERNAAKAALLYDYLDQSTLFEAPVARGSRSQMNVVFRAKGGRSELETRFLAEAEMRGLANLKGHRTAGGMRASLYNAMPLEGVRALVAFCEDFERAAR
ncbi:MAG TPA: 3-phosphoserine/phosphohydroxythreonine transaminase [Kofleriaceae bacterium]|nr:3-phosphoserine/phosphohydroxythreonine transaminase [Kofleriaceae bacterium]